MSETSKKLTGDVEHDLPILSEAVCLAADAYTDCVAEFADEGESGSRYCSEHYDALVTAVNRWKGCHTVALMRRRSGR